MRTYLQEAAMHLDPALHGKWKGSNGDMENRRGLWTSVLQASLFTQNQSAVVQATRPAMMIDQWAFKIA